MSVLPVEGEVGAGADPDSVTVVQITVVDEMYEVDMVFGAAVGAGGAATLLVRGSEDGTGAGAGSTGPGAGSTGAGAGTTGPGAGAGDVGASTPHCPIGLLPGKAFMTPVIVSSMADLMLHEVESSLRPPMRLGHLSIPELPASQLSMICWRVASSQPLSCGC